MKTKMLITMAVLFASTAAFAAPTIEEVLADLGYAGATELSSDWDQLWRDLNGGLEFKAAYAGDDHILGINYYTEDGYASKIWFDGANDDGLWNGTDTDSFDLADNGKSFVFMLHDVTSGNIWYSDPTMNADGKDHMRAFDTGYVDGAGHPIYIIAFEDLPDGFSDWDYNDNVTLVVGAAPIPAPSAILLAGLGLTIVSRFRRR